LLKLPCYPQFRQFRFRLPDGQFRIVKDRIRTESDLKDLIEELNPLDCYYTTSLWRSPLKMHGNGSEGFMGSDICLDIDAHDRSIEEAAKTVKQLSKLFPQAELAFTGRGFRLVLQGYRGIDMTEDSEARKDILRTLAGISGVDIPTLLDPFRVIRVLGTTNSRSGLPCIPIKVEQLDDLSWIEMLPRKEISEPKEKAPFWSIGLVSTVHGTTNHHIIMFDFDNRSLEWVRTKIMGLSQIYGIWGDFFIWETSPNRYSVISPTCLEAPRLLKVLKASKCHSAFINRFAQFNNLFVRLVPKFRIPDNAVIAPQPSLVGIIRTGRGRVSQGHSMWLKSLGLSITAPKAYIGNQNITLREYQYENRTS